MRKLRDVKPCVQSHRAGKERSQNFLLFSFFLRPHLQHMGVPRLGVELKLQLLAYTTATSNIGSKRESAT